MGSAGRMILEELRSWGPLHWMDGSGKEFHLELCGETLAIRGRGPLEVSHTDETDEFLPRREYRYCLEGKQIETLVDALQEDYGPFLPLEKILMEEFEFSHALHPLWQYMEERGIEFAYTEDRLPF